MKFRHHKYTWARPFGSVYHTWELVGPNGAIHFRAIMSDPQYSGPSCGLEFHHLSGDGAPDHLDCKLTGGRCWHDGTSLYAQEQVWPMVEPMLRAGDHEGIFRVLESEYSSHFRNQEASP